MRSGTWLDEHGVRHMVHRMNAYTWNGRDFDDRHRWSLACMGYDIPKHVVEFDDVPVSCLWCVTNTSIEDERP